MTKARCFFSTFPLILALRRLIVKQTKGMTTPSCSFLFRRKSNRAAAQNTNGTLSTEAASVYDEHHLQSPKMYLIPTKSLSSTAASMKNVVSNLPPTHPVVEDVPSVLSTRKRWSRKKNVSAGSKPSTTAATSSTSPEQATANHVVPTAAHDSSRNEVRKDSCSIWKSSKHLVEERLRSLIWLLHEFDLIRQSRTHDWC